MIRKFLVVWQGFSIFRVCCLLILLVALHADGTQRQKLMNSISSSFLHIVVVFKISSIFRALFSVPYINREEKLSVMVPLQESKWSELQFQPLFLQIIIRFAVGV